MRRVTTRGGGPTLLASDLVQSLFVAELLAPSDEIWLLSPWISDIPVIDNSAGAFSALMPSRPVGTISLTDALIYLASQRCHVHVVVRPDARNHLVLDRLRHAGARDELTIETLVMDNLHEKALLSDRFFLHGSMNFTHFGREVNEEALTLDNASSSIAAARIDYRERFSTL
ncbi:phospholipase D-like domain-containing protein DpdK [Mycolicibacterium mucogenicum]|uniref:phospholipase D-like domain-containing protein DpdK n=1 Tax=Mycolicibacterium mucogenicum TaxID=56689 RepID=UPI00226A6B8E|nr:phospholipase D-like domain-containing protein DpdK [Mycolicibacterium mucogenicum]MCX8557527.1 phospholipase D-like domain-containing protein DpdK [Mycolicibacterium mucogenicum]